MDEQPGLTGDERAELERLRAENAVLRAQAQRPDGLAVERGPAGPGPGSRRGAARSWPWY